MLRRFGRQRASRASSEAASGSRAFAALRSALLGAGLLTAAGAAGLSTPAWAAPVVGQVSLIGYAQGVGSTSLSAATGLSFAQGASGTFAVGSGGLTNFGAASGTFAAFGSCSDLAGGCGAIMNLADFTASGPVTGFLTLNTGGAAASFDLASITSVVRTTDSLIVTALGTVNVSGYDPTAATLTLRAQSSNTVSFSATLVVSPAA